MEEINEKVSEKEGMGREREKEECEGYKNEKGKEKNE